MDTRISEPSQFDQPVDGVPALKPNGDDIRSAVWQWDQDERELIDAKDPQGDGGMYQRYRIEMAAAWAAMRYRGDFVEIGVLNGSTTIRLAEVARLTGRKVIAVDPFEIGSQNCSGGEYEIFQQTIAPWEKYIKFLRMRSDDARAVAELQRHDIALAFVDGLHSREGALGDLRAVAHASVIVLDDTRTMDGPRSALEQFLQEHAPDRASGYYQFSRPFYRETYLVTKETNNG